MVDVWPYAGYKFINYANIEEEISTTIASDSRKFSIDVSYSLVLIGLGSVLASFLGLLTLGGNVLVVAAFFKEKKLQKCNNYFLINLAVADSFVGLVSIPFYALYLLKGYWPLGSLVCDLWLTLDYTCCTSSCLSVLVISIDRYWSVAHPIHYRNHMKSSTVLWLILPTWLIPFVMYGLGIFAFHQFLLQPRPIPDNDCYVHYVYQPIYVIASTLINYWIIIAIVLVLYQRIYRITKFFWSRRKKHMGVRPNEKKSNKLTEKNLSTNVTAVVISACQSKEMNVNGSRECGGRKESYLDDEEDSTSSNNNNNNALPSPTSHPLRGPSPIRSSTLQVPRIGTGGGSKGKQLLIASNKQHDSAGDSTLQNKLQGNAPKRSVSFREEDLPKTPGDLPSLPIRKDDTDTHSISSQNKSSNGEKTDLNKTTIVNKVSHAIHLPHRMTNKDQRAMRVFTAVLGFFIFCWTPYAVLVIVQSLCYECVNQSLFYITYGLCYLNSTFNPFVYAYANLLFRETFLRILFCK